MRFDSTKYCDFFTHQKNVYRLWENGQWEEYRGRLGWTPVSPNDQNNLKELHKQAIKAKELSEHLIEVLNRVIRTPSEDCLKDLPNFSDGDLEWVIKKIKNADDDQLSIISKVFETYGPTKWAMMILTTR